MLPLGRDGLKVQMRTLRRTGNRAIWRDVGLLVCRTMEVIGCWLLLLLLLVEEELGLDVLHGRIEVHSRSCRYAQFKRIVVGVHELDIVRVPMSVSSSIDVRIVVETDLIGAIGRLTKVCLCLLLVLSGIICEPIVIVSRKAVSCLLMLVLVLVLILLLLVLLLLLIGGRGWV